MADLSTVNLNRLITFVAVVDAGSLTAAAERLGLAKSMVSKHMQLLEAEVGVGLLLRSTRKLSLTEAGRDFYDASRQLLQQAELAIEHARSGRAVPQGTLRVAAPIDYGVMVVAPVLSQLRLRYPALKVELLCGDSLIDLIAEGIDVTVRLGKLADSGYMAARIGRMVRLLVASPEFVARYGMPEHPQALAQLPYISLTVLTQPNSFTLVDGAGQQSEVRMRNIVFSTNTAPACRAAALAGDGLLRATWFSVREDLAAGRLVRLLPEWSLPEGDIHAVFPATPHLPQKVRVFIDALKLAAGD
ncbi:LysR family transcriptional regulator [Duganella violaceipulchra]|uniref:DNA-binding transcriptional LysR family regulator n=1 Tax=Duganella violaceipulchra TaxID=2849652 RepID=A0AA41L436_9BURK|nr:LysR family transcriptional regulator [Duganella violaceicalia]MBV6324793.1 LysR family transcriptional regulator [Duganella violaceicalia]MCP2009116.1 DNA-binding transcriptional LysR family regulator [Duganella violaceicalia]